MCTFKLVTENILPILAFVVTVITLLVAWYIPRGIMINQAFIALTEQYRSPQMGFTILSIFHFYAEDCDNNPDRINEKYRERYKKEVEDKLKNDQTVKPETTLQFQRRLVAYFYWDLASLRFDSGMVKLGKKRLAKMVEQNERMLISLVLQMADANKSCFPQTTGVQEPPDDEVPMNRLIKRLYEETEDLG